MELSSTRPEREVVFCAQHDWEDGVPVSMSVVEAIAEVTGEDVIDLPPLHEYVDTDALDSLFVPQSTYGRTDGAVSFVFVDHPVTVYSTGEIVVYAES